MLIHIIIIARSLPSDEMVLIRATLWHFPKLPISQLGRTPTNLVFPFWTKNRYLTRYLDQTMIDTLLLRSQTRSRLLFFSISIWGFCFYLGFWLVGFLSGRQSVGTVNRWEASSFWWVLVRADNRFDWRWMLILMRRIDDKNWLFPSRRTEILFYTKQYSKQRHGFNFDH